MPGNLDRIRTVFEAWRDSAGQDASPWFDLADDDIVFRSAAGGREPVGPMGHSNRKAALHGYFDFIARHMQMLEHEIEHYLEDGDMVIAIGQSCWRIRQTGRIFRTRTANLFWFRNGRIIRYENLYDSAALLDASGVETPVKPARAADSRHHR